MKTILALLMIFSFSALTYGAEKTKPADKSNIEKSFKRKIASEEVKCAENPNEGIGIDPDYVANLASKASNCYEASHIVESCGAGSTMDATTTQAAIVVCDKLAGRLSKSDADLKKRMSARCAKVCNVNTDGTLCRSQQSFCQLDVSKFLNSVSAPQN